MDDLRARVAGAGLPWRTTIDVRHASASQNWKAAEIFKTAINHGLVHAPPFELAQLELDGLQRTGQRIDHPSSGPVVTKDVADAMMNVVYTLLEERYDELFARLGGLRLRGTRLAPPGAPAPARPTSLDPRAQLSAFGRAAARRARWRRLG